MRKGNVLLALVFLIMVCGTMVGCDGMTEIKIGSVIPNSTMTTTAVPTTDPIADELWTNSSGVWLVGGDDLRLAGKYYRFERFVSVQGDIEYRLISSSFGSDRGGTKHTLSSIVQTQVQRDVDTEDIDLDSAIGRFTTGYNIYDIKITRYSDDEQLGPFTHQVSNHGFRTKMWLSGETLTWMGETLELATVNFNGFVESLNPATQQNQQPNRPTSPIYVTYNSNPIDSNIGTLYGPPIGITGVGHIRIVSGRAPRMGDHVQILSPANSWGGYQTFTAKIGNRFQFDTRVVDAIVVERN
jgi:hypothetical protein